MCSSDLSFPNSLDGFTIYLKPVLMDVVVNQKTSSRLQENAAIDSVHFSKEAIETIIVLKTGEVAVFRLSSLHRPIQQRELSDKELIDLEHITTAGEFSPYFMFAPGLGPVEACAASDIGMNYCLTI